MSDRADPKWMQGFHVVSPLFLAEDVFFCVAASQGIFLDLKRDLYSGVLLGEGSADDRSSDIVADIDLLPALYSRAAELIEAGLLVKDPKKGSSLTAFQNIRRPTSHILGEGNETRFARRERSAFSVQPTLVDAASFILACRAASGRLRTKHIAEIVDTVRRRKERALNSRVDLDRLRPATAIFHTMRPWYPRGYLCVFDSLALIEFLAHRSLYPSWIFGVHALPFEAHCWVQAEGRLLNESHEYASQFTPIMAV